MKSFDTDLQKYTEKVRLKAAERSELRRRILSYMEYHPLPKKREQIIEKIESQHFVFVHFNTIYTRIAAGVFAILLLVGVPVAAERSVPGDVLYLVKTQINESVQSQFANSPYEKVAFETKLMERRIAEARLLASEGKLTDEVGAEIAETVKGHADAAQKGLAELRVDNADEAAIAGIAFDSALEIQSAVLDTDAGGTTTTKGIAEAVRAAQVDSAYRKGTSTASYVGLKVRVEQETMRVNKFFGSIKDSATDEERSNIERRLADLERRVADAQTMENSDAENAVAELTKTLGFIQKLIVFMTDIDVRENVALETLVPIEFTDEERIEAASRVLADVFEFQAAVESRMLLIDNEGIREKVVLGMEELAAHIARATSSIATGEVDVLEQEVANAYAFASDLDQMTLPFLPNKEETMINGGVPMSEEVLDEGTQTMESSETQETTFEEAIGSGEASGEIVVQ